MSLENQELVAALQAQTAAINGLVQSNQQVIALLTDVVAALDGNREPEDAEQTEYLDGSQIDLPEGNDECL